MSQAKNAQFNIRPGHWVLFFTLAGFALRVQRLSLQPLWGDEGWSFYFVVQSIPQLMTLTAIDIHPPLYYLLLKGWLGLVGMGAEEARLFSVMAGTLLLPVIAVLGRRLANRWVGAAAAGLTALMPLAVYYSQEVRMYMLVTLLGAMSVYFFVRLPRRPQYFWPYVATTGAALYTMYYAAFVVLFQLLFVLFAALRQPKRPAWLTLFKPFIVIGLLYLPWIIYAAPRLVDYIANKRDVEGYTSLNLIHFLGDHFLAFSLGHLPPDLQPYLWAALPMVVFAVLGLGAIRQNRQTVVLYFYLFVPLLLGYLVNLAYPFTPRFFERTLLLVAPAYWLFIALGIRWLWKRQQLLAGATVVALALVTAVNLIAFYTLPRYPDQDYRPLLNDVAAIATPNDTLLASYQWQLGFFHAYLSQPMPKIYPVPGWGAGWSAEAGHADTLAADLNTIFAQSPRLWFPAYQASGHIWEDQAEAAIVRLGYPALLRWYNPQTKLTLAGAGTAEVTPISVANFDDKLTLLAASVGRGAFEAGRDIVPVDLTWQKMGNLSGSYRVSLRLVDAGGHTWASRDSHPQAGQTFFTDLALNELLPDRHGLLTPAGAPPGQYRLLLSLRRIADDRPLNLLDAAGQPIGPELILTEITLVPANPPLGAAALPIQTPLEASFGSQVRLLGYTLGGGPFKAGESLPLTLFWQAPADAPGPLAVQLKLKDQQEQTVVTHQQPPIWPSSEWAAGDLLRDPHDVRLPPTLAPGHYLLELQVLDAVGQPLGSSLQLQTVTTSDRPHQFDPPSPQQDVGADFSGQISLVGLDLPQQTIKAGEFLPLTLYWQALDPPDRSWTVFVHLIDPGGKIVAQQDQIPGGGEFPTSGWLPDEYLSDDYALTIPANTSPGEYWLRIGLYDANDFSRLPLVEADQIVGDNVTLESWPISVE